MSNAVVPVNRFCDTYGELLNGARGLDVLQGGLEISKLGFDLGGSRLGALKLKNQWIRNRTGR